MRKRATGFVLLFAFILSLFLFAPTAFAASSAYSTPVLTLDGDELRWDAVETAYAVSSPTAYHIYFAGDDDNTLDFVMPAGESTSYSCLIPWSYFNYGTVYSCTVRATNADYLWSEYSNTIQIMRAPYINAQSIGATILFSVPELGNNNAHYAFFFKGDGTIPLVVNEKSGSYETNPLKPGEYNLGAKIVNRNQNMTVYSKNTVNLTVSKLSNIEDLAVTVNADTDSFDLDWKDVPYADYYYIEISETDRTGQSGLAVAKSVTTSRGTLSFTDFNIKPDTKYYFRVLASTDFSDGVAYRSSISDTVNATSLRTNEDKAIPTCIAPIGLTATYGQTLSNITLTNPTGNTAGTWSWMDGTQSVDAVGTHTFKAKFVPTDKANYQTVENIDVSVAVSAKAINVTIADIVDQEYTGSQLTPNVTVTGDGKTLVKDTDYTVEYGENKSVGASDGTVTVKAKSGGNYTFADTSKNFNIVIKAGQVTISGNLNVTYGTVVPDVTIDKHGSTGATTVYYYTNADCTAGETTNKPTNAGSYWVKVKMASDANYGSAESNVLSFAISHADIPATAPDAPMVTASAGDGQVTLSWPAPADNGSPITGYTVQQDSETAISVGQDVTTYTFIGLTNGTSYTFKVVAINASGSSNEGTVTATPAAPASSGGGSSGGDSSPASTTKNPDGSVTTTVADTKTGTVTETTEYPDGGTTTVVTETDGTVTTTEVRADDVKIITVDKPEENVTADVTLPSSADKATVTIPSAEATPGTVAVLVNPDGTETIVKKSVATENGMVLTVMEDVTVKLIDNAKTFTDVEDTAWYSDEVAFVSAREIFNGVGNNTFAPNNSMTRGMLARVLHNLEDNPAVAIDMAFDDVKPDAWYADAVNWAEEQGIVAGYGNGKYGPNDNITREQLAVMLWRYAREPETTGSIGHFTDGARTSDYAVTALEWTVENGIINGKGNGVLDPQGKATRAEVAAVLMRYCENVQKGE